MSWLDAAAPRFVSRVSLSELSAYVCGVRLSWLDFVMFWILSFNQINSGRKIKKMGLTYS